MGGYSWWDVISSTLVLAIFIGIVVGVYIFTHKASEATESTKQALRGKGVTVNATGISIQTSAVAPSREEYIAQTQRTFESSAALLSSHPEALSFGNKLGGSTNDVPASSAAADGQRAANGRSATSTMDVPQQSQGGFGSARASREASPMPSDVDGSSVTEKERRGLFRRKVAAA